MSEPRPRANGVAFWSAAYLGCMLWVLYAWSVATPGVVDRFGRAKGWDFPQFYVAGQLARTGALEAWFDRSEMTAHVQQYIPHATYVPVYGPQVALAFAPLGSFPYLVALGTWLAATTAVYLTCCRAVGRLAAWSTSNTLVIAAASPAFFFLVCYGQLSAAALACWTAAFVFLRRDRRTAAGLAFGTLIFKPQLGIAVAIVAVCAREWRVIAAAVVAAFAQIGVAWMLAGTDVMRLYGETAVSLWSSRALIQEKWQLLQSIPAFLQPLLPAAAEVPMYILAAGAVLLLAWRIWASALPLELRFSGLLLATALVNPHMYVYDLTIVTPVWYLLPSVWNGWSGFHRRAMRILLVGLYVVPVLAPPIAATLRLQPATPIMFAMLLLLWRQTLTEASDIAPPSIVGVVRS